MKSHLDANSHTVYATSHSKKVFVHDHMHSLASINEYIITSNWVIGIAGFNLLKDCKSKSL